jgi:5-aminolevulinate synthase
MTLRDHFHSFLDDVRQEDRYRSFIDRERHAARPPYATWHSDGTCRQVVVWCSNDYLGMGRHSAVINAMIESALRVGAGAGGTRNISGNSHAIIALEAEIAEAICQMRRRWARSVGCCQIVSSFRTRRTTPQ